MNRVTLQFPDLHLLWSFAQTLKSHNVEIDTRTAMLSCNCNEENINEAVIKYKATLIDKTGS
jgi:hypothetical protein